MRKEWGDVNKLVSSGGVIPAQSPEAQIVIDAWHKENRGLSQILSRLVEASVSEKLSRKQINDSAQRKKDELLMLREQHQLQCTLDVPDTADPIEVTADLKRRCVDVGMAVPTPEEKKSTKARLNWLMR